MVDKSIFNSRPWAELSSYRGGEREEGEACALKVLSPLSPQTVKRATQVAYTHWT